MKNNRNLLWPANKYTNFSIFEALDLKKVVVKTSWELIDILLN